MGRSDENAIFKALGDPTRRAILDRLRRGPATTGELTDAFRMTRFGVMKHLSVLTGCGLVTVQREGRHRYNHLNALPLRRVYERWVANYADASARRLLSLERHLEDRGRDDMSEPKNFSFHLVQEIQLNASVDRVWAALTKDIGQWWAFHIGPDDSSITCEGRVGGQFIERWGDGEGELYATITYLRRGEKITLEGGMGLAGPGYSKFSYRLEEAQGGTRLILTHDCHGLRDADAEEGFRKGWTDLLENHLRAFLDKSA